MFNVGSVFFGVLLGFWLGPRAGVTPIEGMAYGVVLGGAAQLLWQLPSLRRAGFRFRPAIDWSHPGLRRIIRLMGPAIIGSLKAESYLITPTYSEVSMIYYTLQRQADVTLWLRDPNGSQISLLQGKMQGLIQELEANAGTQ